MVQNIGCFKLLIPQTINNLHYNVSNGVKPKVTFQVITSHFVLLFINSSKQAYADILQHCNNHVIVLYGEFNHCRSFDFVNVSFRWTM